MSKTLIPFLLMLFIPASALAVSDAGGNVEDIKVQDRDGQNYSVDFMLLVKGRQHLADILRSLRRISAVVKISRIMQIQ